MALLGLWTTATNAVGVRRFALGGIIAAALATVHYAAGHGLTWLADVPTWLVAVVVLLGFFAFCFLQYAHEMRLKMTPRVEFLFDGEKIFSEADRSRSYYIHFKNFSGSTITNCQLFLQSMKNGGGKEMVPFGPALSPPFSLRSGEDAKVPFLGVSLDKAEGSNAVSVYWIPQQGARWLDHAVALRLPRDSYRMHVTVYGDSCGHRDEHLELRSADGSWSLRQIAP